MPLAPEEALASFQLAEGFGLEVAASEPQVVDPIAVSFDENGRMYAAEMRGYPLDPPPGGEPAGRIRLLVDEDGDGHFETSTVFADRLHWPSGIACWKGGIFVTAAPDILYLKDTSGDGVADLRRTVFTGFGTGKSEDIVNNLKWGPDQWIYGTTSYNGGTIRHVERADHGVVPLGTNDFRFEPVKEVLEPVTGTGGDFGNAFDDWGNRFASNAGNPLIHAVFPLHSVTEGREPQRLAVPILESERLVYPISRPEPWRVARRNHWSRWVDTTRDMRARRFPPQELALQGYYTGGAGLGIYRGAAYPPEYRGNGFTPESAGNLVLRTVIERAGVTFRARRAQEGREFLASTDNWFRPVNISNGPDGCLYVVDMYREVIEDPSAMPDEILVHIDYYTGQAMGRVYRIVPDGFQRRPPPRLENASVASLVAALEHPDGWWRSTAQRLLIERQAREAAPALRTLARQRGAARSRIHALWSLEGLGELDERTLLVALRAANPGLRQTAVRIAEGSLGESGTIRARIASMVSDEDIAVRYQVALALKGLPSNDAPSLLAAILRQDPGDPWIREAVLAAAEQQPLALLLMLLEDGTLLADPDGAGVVRRLAEDLSRTQGPTSAQAVLNATLDVVEPYRGRFRMAAAAGTARGLAQSGLSLRGVLAGEAGPELEQAIGAVLAEAPAVAAAGSGTASPGRTDAIGLLAWAPREAALVTLGALLVPDEPAQIQLAAVRSLAVHEGRQVGQVLVDAWRSYSPAVRREATEVLFGRAERLEPFLDAVESGAVLAAQLDPVRRTALLNHPREPLRTRARGILGRSQDSTPDDAVRRYQAALANEGDDLRGAEVFERECATCHRVGAMGHEVGPDLRERAAAGRQELLVDILDPNRSVRSNFVNYRVDAIDGRVLSGILARESADSVTLRRGEGVQDVIPRSQIDTLVSMGLSLMPEGLEAEIDPAEMTDLLSFLESMVGR